jgi:spore coat polysaccharide biosynthesis protein SpsF (cytidylyltransferase family)|tara:strand:+ start:115 stop:255 length:141 start_codon:yes stop_codon:yes gene_type:complete
LYGIEVFADNEEDILDMYFYRAKEFKLDIVIMIISDYTFIIKKIII